MRALLLILMVLGVVASAGLGIMVGQKNLHSEDAKELDGLVETAESLSGGESNSKLDELKAMASGVKTSGWGGYIVGGLAVLLLIVGFMKKWSPIMAISVLGILASVAFIILSPSFDMGPNGPLPPRGQAIVYGGAFILAALSAMGAEKLRLKKLLGDDAF